MESLPWVLTPTGIRARSPGAVLSSSSNAPPPVTSSRQPQSQVGPPLNSPRGGTFRQVSAPLFPLLGSRSASLVGLPADPKASSHTSPRGPSSAQDVLLCSIASLLDVHSNHILSHVNESFQQQQRTIQNALEKAVATKERQHAIAQQAVMGPLLNEQEKRVTDCIRGCFQSIQQHPVPNPIASSNAVVSSNAGSPVRKVDTQLAQQRELGNSLDTPLLEGQKCQWNRQTSGQSDATLVRRDKGCAARIDSIFPKTEALKHDVLDSLRKMRYDVENYYHTSGMFQAIARDNVFKSVILFVIALNTIWIAVETDHNHATLLCNADLVFQVVDNAFCFVFFSEILIRFMAFNIKSDALHDGWFVFDASLVALMVWETWIMVAAFLIFGYSASGKAAKNSQALRMFRLVRLVRVARATRLLSFAPELLILARGMIAGVRSVMAVFSLLALLIYVFAVVFTMTLAGTPIGAGSRLGTGRFDNVPTSMNFLLLQVLCGPDAEFIQTLLDYHWVYYVVYLGFLLLAVLTLMNMLIGILCDVVSTVSIDAKEEEFSRVVEEQLTRLAAELDTDGSGGISKDEFDIMVKDPAMTASFNELGVDLVAVADFGKFVYEQCEEISYIDFGLLLSQFRVGKLATIKDVMDMRRYMTVELLSLESRFATVQLA